jgi:putative membrane protein
LIELLLFALAGMAFGILAGIVPGLHVNTLALMMLGLAGTLEPLGIAVAIISMAISTTFFDFIPSTLLGAPDPDTALSVLPGHRMLMTGRGLEAIYLTMTGGLCATLLAAACLPLFLVAIPFLYAAVQGYIAWLLVAIAAFCVLSESSNRLRLWALLILLLSGALGTISLNSSAFGEPLFPMFTGLFGASSLIFSLGKRSRMPRQSMRIEPPKGRTLASGVLKGLVSGSLVGTLPAMGAAQAALVAEKLGGRGGDREYLVSIGAINTIVAVFSLVSLYTISKARSGAAVAVGRLLPEFGLPELMVMAAVILLAAGVSSLLLMRTARWFVSALSGINYASITKAVLVFLAALVAVFSGPAGILLMAVSTAIGLLAPLSGARRSTAMGCLMIPLIFFYMGV